MKYARPKYKQNLYCNFKKNTLVLTKKLKMALGATFGLLLIGSWLGGDLRWLVAYYSYYLNKVKYVLPPHVFSW